MNVKYNFDLYYSALLLGSVNVCTRASSIVKARPIFAWTRLQTKIELQRMREVCYPDASQQQKESPEEEVMRAVDIEFVITQYYYRSARDRLSSDKRVRE